MAVKIHNAEFITGAAYHKQFPKLGLPEVCFAGRSNVGKSSLINSIVRRKNLAYTSQMPGKTQQINFFNVDGLWTLADLPGFGYATIGKQHREDWAKLNVQYFEKRDELRFVCVLIDARHDPMDNDISLIEWLELNEKPYLIILTKCDKLSPKRIGQRKEQVEHLVSQCKFIMEVLPYSSVSALGRNELLAILGKNLV